MRFVRHDFLSRMYFLFVSAEWQTIFKISISGWLVILSQIFFMVNPETLTPPPPTFVCLCLGSSLTDSSVNSISEADVLSLSFTSNVCFSIWVSFCEIYNDNIHDLLEQVRPSQLVTYTVVSAKRSILSICNFVSNMSWIVLPLWLMHSGSQWTPQTHSVASVTGCQRKLLY